MCLAVGWCRSQEAGVCLGDAGKGSGGFVGDALADGWVWSSRRGNHSCEGVCSIFLRVDRSINEIHDLRTLFFNQSILQKVCFY
jgi:hypothetical protein